MNIERANINMILSKKYMYIVLLSQKVYQMHNSLKESTSFEGQSSPSIHANICMSRQSRSDI